MKFTSQPISPLGVVVMRSRAFCHLAVKLLSDGLPIQCHGVLSLLHHAGDCLGNLIPYSPNKFSQRYPLSTTNLLVRSSPVW